MPPSQELGVPSESADCAKSGFVLNDDVIASRIRSALHRAVARELLEAVNTLTPGCARVTLAVHSNGSPLITVTPSVVECSTINVLLYEEPHVDDEIIGVWVGHGSGFNAPESVDDTIKDDLPKAVGNAVSAIIHGHLEETLYYRGEIPYRFDLMLPTDDGVILSGHTDIPQMLKNIFKRRSMRTFRYPAYEDVP